MTKRKNKGKGVRSKSARGNRKVAGSKAIVATLKRGDPAFKKTAKPVKKSQSQSESQDAEGGTPGAAPSIQELAMELGSTPVDPPHRCPNCDSYHTVSRMERDEFAYGVAPDSYVLTADVLVFQCFDCKERWTGEQAEAARQAAVDAHLAQKKAAEDGEIFL